MSLAPPERGPLTSYLFGVLQATFTEIIDVDPKPMVGDGVAPAQAGWTQGQPGKGPFVPYAVLKAVPTTRPGRQPIGDAQQAWVLLYVVTSWGAVREQADMVADKAAGVLGSISRVPARGSDDPLPTPGYGIQLVEMTTLGSTERNDAVAPPLWSRSDTVSVSLARARRG